MEVLRTLSSELAGIVETLGPSVVRVEARRRAPASGVVWAPEGLVLTADHVVELEERIRIGLADGRAVAASLVGRDPTTDIAVLRAEAGGLVPAGWADAREARVGHMVLSLGRPGRTVRARLGVLSAVAGGWRAPGGVEIDRYIEIDTGPAEGFSGGPVADATGAVLGMRTSGLLRRTALALPASTVRRVVETLVMHGRVRRGYLGIGTHPVRLPSAVRQEVDRDTGLLVLSVEPGSPAEQAGLLLGDVVLRLGEIAVGHAEDLLGLLNADRIGTTLPAQVLRAGAVRIVNVLIGERR